VFKTFMGYNCVCTFYMMRLFGDGNIYPHSHLSLTLFLLTPTVQFLDAVLFSSSSSPQPLTCLLFLLCGHSTHVFSLHAGPQLDSKHMCFPLKRFPEPVIQGTRADAGVIVHSQHTKGSGSPKSYCLTVWKMHNQTQHCAHAFFPLCVPYSLSKPKLKLFSDLKEKKCTDSPQNLIQMSTFLWPFF